MVTIGYLNHRVINHQHITKDDERSSQKHEAVGTERMYADMQRQNVTVLAHAHDRNETISNIIARQVGPTDNLDTWHASKEVKKSMAKVSKGALKNIGITWHPQLADKVAGVKTHTYYAMKNCAGNADALRASLGNVVEHYQNNHINCPPTSRCKTDNPYVPSRLIVTENIAITLLRNAIQGLFMYKNPQKYTNCMDTHYVESFNNAILVYTDKRVHFGKTVYLMRINLAIMDWNENVDREVSSLRNYVRARNPNSQTPTRILKPKTYRFVEQIWQSFVRGEIMHGAEVLDADIAEEDVSDNEDEDNSFVDV